MICFHVPFDTIFHISCLHHILKTIWWHILITLFIRFVSSSIPFFIFFFLGGDLTIKGSWISMGIFMANPMSMARGRKLANFFFTKIFQHFTFFLKLIREISLFWNSIFGTLSYSKCRLSKFFFFFLKLEFQKKK